MSAADRSRSGGQAPARTLVVLGGDWPALAAAGAMGLGPDVPVAVVEQQRVIAALGGARAMGVRARQRRRETEAHCPDLVVLARDAGAEARAFEPVVRLLETLGVPVTLRRPGWASLPTRAPARRHGGEEALRQSVAALIGPEAGAVCWSLGVADGPFAAAAAARQGLVVPSSETREFLAPLGVETLGDPELADLLRRLGIGHLGEFAALDEGAVLARFGAAGGRAHRLARGLEGSCARPRRTPVRLDVMRAFDPPAERLEEVVLVARGLAEELGGRLSSRGLVCTLLRVEAETADGRVRGRAWSDEWGSGAGLVAERLRWQLEAWLLEPEREGECGAGRAITALRLVPLEAIPARGRQLGLWGRSAQRADDEERMGRIVARVQGMLEPTAVLRPVAAGGRGPGERICLVPVGDPLPVTDTTAPWPGRLPAPSPAVVPVAPPLALLTDAEGAPVGVDGRGELSAAPLSLVLGGAPPRRVASWRGPFPADERWWDRRRHRRRARLQVLTAEGGAYLLVLEGGSWTLEGRYD